MEVYTADKPRKVIFLDYDGPMIPARAGWLPMIPARAGWLPRHGLIPGCYDTFDPCAVAMLNNVIDITGAKLVISATVGARGREFNELYLGLNGIRIKDLHDDWVTERTLRYREDQIEFWLDEHPEVRRYAVLDDSDMIARFGERMVKVTYVDGLLSEHRQQLIDLLGDRDGDKVWDHYNGDK